MALALFWQNEQHGIIAFIKKASHVAIFSQKKHFSLSEMSVLSNRCMACTVVREDDV